MTEHELNNRYFEWMYSLVCDQKYFGANSYRKLLYRLYNIEFTYVIPMDANRADDGINLRYKFGNESDIDQSMISTYLDNFPCSVLEMMVGLASRCEVHIMFDPEFGDRTSLWFQNMLISLGLDSMDDWNYDRNKVDWIIARFLDREYAKDGKGGLFTLKGCRNDMRRIDIWCQLNWYLNEISKERS